MLILFYGPPGWGENQKTDSRLTYYYIELEQPINVVDSKKQNYGTVTNIEQVQLIKFPPKEFIGKKVKADGFLSGQETGYHRKKVLMDNTALVVE